MAVKTSYVYVLLTEMKIHAYSNWSRATKIRTRAERMGVKYEYMAATVKSGDPYERASASLKDANRDLFNAWGTCPRSES